MSALLAALWVGSYRAAQGLVMPLAGALIASEPRRRIRVLALLLADLVAA